MPAALFLDLSHTSHTRARTGVQRVARSLSQALAGKAAALCFDPFEDAWRPLRAFEERNLSAADPAPGRGARWPLSAKIRGRLKRMLPGDDPLARVPRVPDGGPSGVIVPEIFSPAVGRALPRLFAATTGPRIALFHDALALQFPEYTPRGSVARFPGYLRELLQFDGVAAVSEASRQVLLDYWEWLGVSRTPEVATIPLGLDLPAAAGEPGDSEPVPTLLCVGSIEARKNHVSLLEACEFLWGRGLRFNLRLVGLANAETGGAGLARIAELKSAGRPIRYDGPVGEDELDQAYQACSFTIYPSLAEGFGLPVAESLARGKPCLCRMDGALGEIARDGGCVSIGAATAQEIATAIEGVLASPDRLGALGSAARARRFKTWASYTDELIGWMRSLKQNA